MRKMILIAFLNCLPFTQMASALFGSACPSEECAPTVHKPAPELPLNALNYFVQ